MGTGSIACVDAEARRFGAIDYDARLSAFRVTCEPYVSLRLKRLFAQLDDAAPSPHLIRDTPDHARDLEWLLARYPMDVHCADRLAARAALGREREQHVHSLLSGRAAPIAFDLASPARDYQRLAASLVLTSQGLLLADDVGLGKTVSAICTLADPRTRPALVVTLTHLPGQWARELRRFAPALRVHVIESTSPYDTAYGTRGPCTRAHRFDETGRCVACHLSREEARHGQRPRSPDVLVLNYAKLSGWAETLAGYVRCVVYDEVQELRSADSVKYKAAQHLSAAVDYRLGLSATPIYNYGGEIFNVLDVLQPGHLGTRIEFAREWCTHTKGDRPRLRDARLFGRHARERGLLLRRTRSDVARELPALSTIRHAAAVDAASLEAVSAACTELARVVLSDTKERGAKMNASEELSTRLRQATGIAKAGYVADFVRALVQNGERVVLFGWHRSVYRLWLERLVDLKPALYTGSESIAKKDEARRAFLDGEARVLIMSLRSGAGLDGLQECCRTVVFGELDWSPGVHEQCIGRVHRDGQSSPVMAYFLVANEGSDPIVADILDLKEEQVGGIRNPDANLVTPLEVEPGHIRRLAEAYLAQRGQPVVHALRGALSEDGGRR